MRVPPLPVPIRYVHQGWLAEVPGRPVPVAAASLEVLLQVVRLAALQAQHIADDGWVSLRLTPPTDVALDGPHRTAVWLKEFIENTTALRLRFTARALVVNERHEALLIRSEATTHGTNEWFTPGTHLTPDCDHHQLLRDALVHDLALTDPHVGPALWISASLRPVSDWEGSVDVAYLVTSTGQSPTAPGLPGTHTRWWTFDELRRTEETLTPQSLPWYLDAVTRDEIPMRPPTFVIPPSEADIAEHFQLAEDAYSS